MLYMCTCRSYILQQELFGLLFPTTVCILSALCLWIIRACKIQLFQELIFRGVAACYGMFRDGVWVLGGEEGNR